MFEHFMDVGHRQRRQLVRTEHAIDQITQAVGLFNDDFGVVLQMLLGKLAGQQLRGATDATQRILDFMGQAAHQHLGGFLLGQLRLFLGNTQQPVARQHLQQQHGFLAGQYWCHRVVHGQRLAGGGSQRRFALGERVSFFNSLAQCRQGFRRLGEQFADELPVAALATDGEQHFGCGVHVFQAQARIEQQCRGGQVLDQQALQGFVDHDWSASGSSGRKCKNQTKRAIAARIGVMLQPYGLSGDPNW